MGLKDVLATQGPRFAMMALASAKGGREGLAGLMEGIRQRDAAEQQQARQQQMDGRAGELHDANLANMDADNDRLAQQQEMEKLNAAIRLIQQATTQQTETAHDPVQAENAILQQAQSAAGLYGLPPDQLTGLVPNMSGPITGRKKKLAQEMYDRAVKTFGEEAIAQDAITLQTGDVFGDVKPSQLRALFSAPAIDAQGAPVSPAVGKRTPATPGSFEEYVDAPPDRQAAIEAARQRYMQADDRTPQGSSSRFWVYRNGQPVRITEAEYQPGDQPAGTREQGRPVTSGDANRIIDIDTGLNDLKTLRRTLTETENATGTRAQVGAALPNWATELTGWGTDAKKRQGVIALVKQIIGKALEGGVLRKEDEYKYAKILPTIGDPPEVAMSKLDGLETELKSKRGIMLEGYSDAGFDTSKFSEQGAGAGGDADPLGLFK